MKRISPAMFKGLYEVSDTGIVINTKTGKPLKGEISNAGYMRVRIENKSINIKRKYSVHRLVAMLFVPNELNKPHVNHINGNKLDNRAENLEWVTASENMIHATAMGLNKIEKFRAYTTASRKAVTNGEQTFESITSAAAYLSDTGRCKNVRSGIAGVSGVIRGLRPRFGGYTWKTV